MLKLNRSLENKFIHFVDHFTEFIQSGVKNVYVSSSYMSDRLQFY